MKLFIYLSCLLHICLFNVEAQRVAPGVPPQHYGQQQQAYQPQVPQQQYQQYQQPQVQQHQQVPVQHVPVQQQQIPVQQQQIPVQQQQQQQIPVQQHVPVQQQVPVPVQQQQQANVPHAQAHHYAHGQPQQILSAANIAQEKQHIADHMEVPIDTSKMSEQELQFHYFKMHDADNNNKLDGCELIKSLIHWHEQGSKEKSGHNHVEEKVFKDDELINLIDPILNVDDTNQDGYIDYPEFIRAQQKAAGQPKPSS